MINVWPALADLMTVLAVPALSTAIGMFPLLGQAQSRVPWTVILWAFPGDGQAPRLLPWPGPPYRIELDPQPPVPTVPMASEETEKLDSMRALLSRLEDGHFLKVDGLSLTVTMPLAHFERGSAELELNGDEVLFLVEVCGRIEMGLDNAETGSWHPWKDLLIEVEGHASVESSAAMVDRNWEISAERAVALHEAMRAQPACQRVAERTLRITAYGSSKPQLSPGGRPMVEGSRRVELRIVPASRAL